MLGRRAIVGIGALGLLAAGGPAMGQEATPAPGTVEVVGTYTIELAPIGETLNGILGEGVIADDRGIPLGGLGSDLWRSPGDPEGEFWMITDRGPNVDVEVDGEERLTFPVPEFTPTILHVRATGDVLELVEAIPVVGQSGAGVTGLPNRVGADPQPWGYRGEQQLDFNPSGLDTEGLVRGVDGSFWLADEYAPSLVKVGEDGVVAARYVPAGTALTGADYPVEETLPAIYGARRGNRGFEGLAISPDQSTLYLLLQSPLNNPDKDTGEASRIGRLLVVDVATGTPTAEYAYVFEEGPVFDPAEGIEQGDMKLSGIVSVDADSAIVLERTDDVARLYTIEFGQATNLLGSQWDDPATAPSLEAADLEASGVKAVGKTLLADLALPGMPTKIEGLAVVDAQTIAVANDNDFDLGSLENGADRWISGEKPNRVLLVRVAGGLPAASVGDASPVVATPVP